MPYREAFEHNRKKRLRKSGAIEPSLVCLHTRISQRFDNTSHADHARFGPLMATVAGFWGVCDLPCGAPYKSLVEIYTGPHIGGPKMFVLGVYVHVYVYVYAHVNVYAYVCMCLCMHACT